MTPTHRSVAGEPDDAEGWFTPAQAAAAARILYAAEQPGSVTVLCGPAGVGKTTVLKRVAEVMRRELRSVRLVTLAELDPRGTATPDADWKRPEVAPDVLLLDEADRGMGVELVAAVERWQTRQPRVAIVLAGEGRLLSLLAEDARLERAVRLRAVLPTFTLGETRRLLADRFGGSNAVATPAAICTIHEIAAGVPAAALRLADIAALMAADSPGADIHPDAIEAIHRRLGLTAA